MVTRVHIVAEGLVQGVGFRWFVAQRANALGITGWTENLSNGSVEIVAEGERGALEELLQMVKVGPRSAHVTNLRVEWLEQSTPHFTHFQIR